MPQGQLKHRKLRFAWSIAWCAMGLALTAACFALQYRGADVDVLQRAGPGPTAVQIYHGKLFLSWEPRTPYRPPWAGQTNHNGFRYNLYSDGSWNVMGPLWVLGALVAAIAATSAAAPWLAWRFSLRTLLIATTIAAAALGFFVWTAHIH